MTQRKFLDEVYTLDEGADAGGFYDAWAATYDAEVGENGYVTPGRVAEALAGAVEDKAAPVLDYGCGTGLSGLALRAAGFETVDGWDPSQGMVEKARATAAYRDVAVIDPEALPPGDHRHIVACGVFSPGHAPASTVDALLNRLRRGGVFAFSLNDHALAERTYEGRVTEWVDGGWARVVCKDYGRHLPGADLKSMVYALERL